MASTPRGTFTAVVSDTKCSLSATLSITRQVIKGMRPSFRRDLKRRSKLHSLHQLSLRKRAHSAAIQEAECSAIHSTSSYEDTPFLGSDPEPISPASADEEYSFVADATRLQAAIANLEVHVVRPKSSGAWLSAPQPVYLELDPGQHDKYIKGEVAGHEFPGITSVFPGLGITIICDNDENVDSGAVNPTDIEDVMLDIHNSIQELSSLLPVQGPTEGHVANHQTLLALPTTTVVSVSSNTCAAGAESSFLVPHGIYRTAKREQQLLLECVQHLDALTSHLEGYLRSHTSYHPTAYDLEPDEDWLLDIPGRVGFFRDEVEAHNMFEAYQVRIAPIVERYGTLIVPPPPPPPPLLPVIVKEPPQVRVKIADILSASKVQVNGVAGGCFGHLGNDAANAGAIMAARRARREDEATEFAIMLNIDLDSDSDEYIGRANKPVRRGMFETKSRTKTVMKKKSVEQLLPELAAAFKKLSVYSSEHVLSGDGSGEDQISLGRDLDPEDNIVSSNNDCRLLSDRPRERRARISRGAIKPSPAAFSTPSAYRAALVEWCKVHNGNGMAEINAKIEASSKFVSVQVASCHERILQVHINNAS